MKRTVLVTLTMLVLTSPALSAEWYEGGTLHNSTIKEWRNASPQNRLATAGDFTAAILKDSLTFEEVVLRTPAMLSCINEVAKTPNANRQKVAAIGALCAILLGWQ